MEANSEIINCYKDKNVFLTGGTGFLGQLLAEKLLRVCKVNKIYFLIRQKGEATQEERFKKSFEIPLFEPLRKQDPNFITRVTLITGDCALPELGISSADQEFLKNNIHIIIHSAATVKFNESLKSAADINVKATKHLIDLAKTMPKLKIFIHLSTIISQCDKTHIDEKFYKPPMTFEELYKLFDLFDEKQLEALVPTLLGKWENTYGYTKCIAEDVIKNEAIGLPVVVLRPGIGTLEEPIAGWTNTNGPAISLCNIFLGFQRTLHCNPRTKMEYIPADYAINFIISAGWDLTNRNKKQEIPIYNIVSSPEAPITLREYGKYGFDSFSKIPSVKCIWYPVLIFSQCAYMLKVAFLFLHLIPAHFFDLLAKVMGKKPFVVDLIKKINKFVNAISYFLKKHWTFSNNNAQLLWKKVGENDKKIFHFSMENFDWKSYFDVFCTGIRIYLIKDPLSTLEAGRRKYLLLKIVHYLTIIILCYLLYLLCKIF